MVNIKLKYNVKLLAWLIAAFEIVFWIITLNIYYFLFSSGDDFRFEKEDALWYLLVLPVFIAIILIDSNQKNKIILRYASINQFAKLGFSFKTWTRFLHYLLVRNAIFFLILGYSNPQYGKGKAEADRMGIDLMIGLDVSNSMLAEDVGNNMNRLRFAKLSIERLISKLHGDRIGLVVFAGDAFVQIPLTNDYSAAKLFLSSVSTNMLTAQGTAIGRAISKCMESYNFKSLTKKAMVIISDGENHEDDALSAAQNAKANGVKVYTIGIGSLNGSPIPLIVNGHREGVKRDMDGNTVMTKLNQQMLVEVAEAGGGVYVKSSKNQFGLDELFTEINKLEKKKFDTILYTDYDDQFYYFLWIALVLFLTDFILGYLPVLK